MKKTRDESQEEFVDLWIANNCYGSLLGVTGYGKTICSIKCALKSKALNTAVIVPTKELKKQWLEVTKSFKLPNVSVYIVNTAAKLNLECDLLIVDESHTTGMADWFKLGWKNAKFNKLIGLSASPLRKDGKHKDFLEKAPILMSVGFKEALENGWISNYTIYNVGVELTKEEQIKYDDIILQLDILYDNISKLKKLELNYVQKNTFILANQFLKSKKWQYIKLAVKYYKLIGERKTLLYNADNKLVRIVNYINNNPDKKVLVFSQSQEFADKLQDKLKDICVTIHSKLKDKDRENNLKKFKDKRTKIRVISSIKALNEGIDIPELDVGIMASGTSSKKDAIQTLGRICRLHGNKYALFFNLYIKDTQDQIWLRNRTYELDREKIKWI